MWRIYGLIFFGNKDYFYDPTEKKFKLDLLIPFLEQKGIAIYDTASTVKRLQGNASDKFLEVIEQTDIKALLKQIPLCHAICVTGEKAASILAEQMDCGILQIAKPIKVTTDAEHDKAINLYRMPSSSRSYPLALQKKAVFYKAMFEAEFLL